MNTSNPGQSQIFEGTGFVCVENKAAGKLVGWSDAEMDPFLLCFIGTSGSGKTTLADETAKILKARNVPLQVIDGDVLRGELGNLFGFTKAERKKQTQVVKVLSKYLLRQNVNVLLAIVAPYDEIRKDLRNFFGASFCQVYVKCPYEVCEKRDVKGYYRLAKQNRMQNLNGANDIYEIPADSDLVVDTSVDSVEVCVGKVLSFLKERGYVT